MASEVGGSYGLLMGPALCCQDDFQRLPVAMHCQVRDGWLATSIGESGRTALYGGLMKIIAAWQFGQVKRVICEPNSLSQRDYKPLAGGKRSATTGNA